MNILIFVLLIFLIYLLSLKNVQSLYLLFLKITKNQKLTYTLLSLLFFPGTIIHEFSHFFAAIFLFLNVRGIQIFPKFENNQIKLGTVLYEKKDPIRGVLVGIAPLFGAFLLFFSLSYFNIFPNNNLGLNIAIIYLIFSISSTMFSSKQDLVDLIYIIPFILILSLNLYIFDIKINVSIKNQLLINYFSLFLEKTNYMLFISLLIHLIIYFLIQLFKKSS